MARSRAAVTAPVPPSSLPLAGADAITVTANTQERACSGMPSCKVPPGSLQSVLRFLASLWRRQEQPGSEPDTLLQDRAPPGSRGWGRTEPSGLEVIRPHWS